ncbi:hypothetical protein ABFS82_08G101600 [Erythranthe guttata]
MASDSLSILTRNEHKPLPISTVLKREQPDRSNSTSKPCSFISLVISTSVTPSATIALAFLFFSASTATSLSVNPVSTDHHSILKSLSKLKHPVVILVSFDGFRFEYQYKTDTPNIDQLIKNGTKAELGLIPVFPTLTFPNHYSIATGLYPTSHGIINNNREPKWSLGEPLWERAANHGLKAATYFWPGSDDYCMLYNSSVTFEERVDTILNYFDLSSDEIPLLMALYLEDPDSQGHEVSPNDPRVTESVANVDKLVGRLITGLEQRGIFEDVHIIMVGDHGMVGTCHKKLIFLNDLLKWIDIPSEWAQSYTPLLAIRPPANYSAANVVAKMNEGLKSGNVTNGEYLRVYLKEDLPSRLHYSDSERVPPIIGLVAEGFKIEQTNSGIQECAGAHGYDTAYFSMRTIFIRHGPKFAKGKKIQSFENVEIYNLVTKILKMKGASNNGTKSFAKDVLLPSR